MSFVNKQQGSDLELLNFSSRNLALRREKHAHGACFKPYMALCSLQTAVGNVGC
jgi:hypothetical protein